MSQTITEALFEMQDLKYRDFTQKLIPDIEKEKIIGVRVPDLRAYAKKYYMSDAARDFL